MERLQKGEDINLKPDEKYLVPHPKEEEPIGVQKEKLARFDIKAAFMGAHKAMYANDNEIEQWKEDKQEAE